MSELAKIGEQKIAWVKAHMPLLSSIEQDFLKTKPFAGLKISLSVHLEAKTAYLARVLESAGALLSVTGSNPYSTKDDVVAALRAKGMRVFAKHGVSREQYENFVRQTLENGPDILIDDGGDLLQALDEKAQSALIACCEQTTSGVLRAKASYAAGKLKAPVVCVNDAKCKHLFDNRYGTGQATFEGIMAATNLLIAGKSVVIIGYGHCGLGVAQRAQGLGASVIICETDPFKALSAYMQGFAVMPLLQAASLGDIFISATGGCDALSLKHFKAMKNGAIVCNTGHFQDEINLSGLVEKEEARAGVRRYELGSKYFYLLGSGALVNVACANGHPAEIMDMSFACQALSAHWALENRPKPGIYELPEEIDSKLARLKLHTLGIKIDSLNEQQKNYLKSFTKS